MTRMIGEQDYSTLAQDLLARVSKRGATAADVMVADGETLSVQVRMGAVDRLTKAREKRLGLRVFFGQRSASASTSDFSRRFRIKYDRSTASGHLACAQFSHSSSSRFLSNGFRTLQFGKGSVDAIPIITLHPRIIRSDRRH